MKGYEVGSVEELKSVVHEMYMDIISKRPSLIKDLSNEDKERFQKTVVQSIFLLVAADVSGIGVPKHDMFGIARMLLPVFRILDDIGDERLRKEYGWDEEPSMTDMLEFIIASIGSRHVHVVRQEEGEVIKQVLDMLGLDLGQILGQNLNEDEKKH